MKIFSPMTNGSSDTDNEIENEGKPEIVETELEEIVVEKPVSKSLSTNMRTAPAKCLLLCPLYVH